MSLELGRLQAALADRYVVERELGTGGMASVYLARDVKNVRLVAVKVLLPEVALGVGSERFLHEIKIAANLNHPHILPLHDSGEVDGFVYYVMPYMEGESLRARLDREHRIPVDEAVRLGREIADALSYAHDQGIIHRDIKPGNVLISNGHAVIADFGIARALSEGGADERLTKTGVAIGSPHYMSPEQIGAESEIDGRSDVYSLGCVLYEMITGRVPFEASSAKAIGWKHLMEEPQPLGEVPPEVEATVLKALEKSPDDRFASAAQMAAALEATTTGQQTSQRAVHRRRQAPWIAAVVVSVALGSLAILRWPLGSTGGGAVESMPVDPNLVAVLPFRILSADPDLQYLQEGMVDLLAARLTGEAGPRAIDPRTLLSAWRRAVEPPGVDAADSTVFALAARLGAGRVIAGSIVGTPNGLVISASLRELPGGRIRADVRVEGPADNLVGLVDELAGQLLALEAGESEHRLEALTSTSIEALRAYLDGQGAYRRGEYDDAVTSFQNALATDSTFALAGIGLRNAASWTAFPQDAMDRGTALAWASRERLSPRDREYLDALAGPDYPAPASISSQLDAWERAVSEGPDKAEAWWGLGEILLHWGQYINAEAPQQRAAAAFDRVLALDSTFTPPLEHLYDIASMRGDGEDVVRTLGTLLLERGAGNHPEVIEWQTAMAVADTAALSAARGRLQSIRPELLALVVFYSQIATVWAEGLDDADVAVERMLDLAATRAERVGTLTMQHDLALNRGRPAAALAATEEMMRLEPDDPTHLRNRILDALYWDGDPLAAADAARVLAAGDSGSGPETPGGLLLGDVCVLEQWRLRNDDTSRADATIARLRGAADASGVTYTTPPALCALQLQALHSHLEGRPDASVWSARLDSLLRTGPVVDGANEANLSLARILNQQGNLTGALAAAQRHYFQPGGERYLSTFLRETGRLAADSGDTTLAIRAYEHYLALRAKPDPELEDDVAAVRDTVAALLGAGS